MAGGHHTCLVLRMCDFRVYKFSDLNSELFWLRLDM